jgi:hypothetical protein
MKFAAIAMLMSSVAPGDASSFRNLVDKFTKAKHFESDIANVNAHEAADAAVDQNQDESENQEQRQLQNLNNCVGDNDPPIAWHPNYSLGWSAGVCRFVVDCNSPAFSTQLACCKGAYAGQVDGTCLASLPNPPTTAPTETGGLSVYYPDYSRAWPEGICINERPLPSGRPTYSTVLACCKGAYGGQTSGACLASLPNPPTTSPTETGGLSVYYPDYDTAWTMATCLNERPLPSGRPTYTSQLACCRGAYGGQTSLACICAVDACSSCRCPGDLSGCGSLTCS